MKTRLFTILLALIGYSTANGQDCCQGFEAAFTFEHANNPLGVIFHNTSSGEWNAVIWHFGDGGTSNGSNPDHMYSEPGLYEVCVVIENDHGCRSELCRTIAVNMDGNPCGDFLADFNHDVNLENLTVNFTNTSGSDSQFHIWHFGDGSTSDDSSPHHQYDGPGVYQVCLVIENGDCRSEYCREVCVEDLNPCAEFGASFSSVISQVSPLQINFQGNYSGGITGVTWHFGDGTTSHSEHPEHVYAEPGVYQVCLVVENGEGCHSEFCTSLTVGFESEPCQGFEAGFTYTHADNPLGVIFTDASSGEWSSIVWHFGDGATASGAHPDHLYAESGLYQVCVVIENGQGCVSEFCLNVAVNIPENPCSDFEAHFNHEAAQGSLAVHFNDASTVDAQWHIWHFGDGSTSDGANPVHEYAEPGIYQVCMVIESGDCRSEYCISISVGAMEDPCSDFSAGFIYEVDLIHGGVHFENLSSPGAIDFQWHFGDGTESDSEEPSHEFELTGLHNVCVRVENEHGCVAEFCMNVHVPAYYFFLVPPSAVETVETDGRAAAVFPNPFTDEVQFTASGVCQVDVIDMQGRTVFTKGNVNNGKLDLSVLNSGLYLLRTTSLDGATRSSRIVKR
ncbi:MAG: PKD domain-containing protein [Flavobacteriales bacterium]|nr:PKD domain-containing protein [Flavobacteriales bacterium]